MEVEGLKQKVQKNTDKFTAWFCCEGDAKVVIDSNGRKVLILEPMDIELKKKTNNG